MTVDSTVHDDGPATGAADMPALLDEVPDRKIWYCHVLQATTLLAFAGIAYTVYRDYDEAKSRLGLLFGLGLFTIGCPLAVLQAKRFFRSLYGRRQLDDLAVVCCVVGMGLMYCGGLFIMIAGEPKLPSVRSSTVTSPAPVPPQPALLPDAVETTVQPSTTAVPTTTKSAARKQAPLTVTLVPPTQTVTATVQSSVPTQTSEPVGQPDTSVSVTPTTVPSLPADDGPPAEDPGTSDDPGQGPPDDDAQQPSGPELPVIPGNPDVGQSPDDPSVPDDQVAPPE